MKVRKQRKEVLVSDVVEKALQENQRKRNNVLSSSRKKKLRRRAMVLEQQGIPLIENKATIVYSPEENETILSSTGFIRTVEDKVSFISETGLCPLNVPDSSTEGNSSLDAIPSCTLSDSSPVQIEVDDINRTTSEQLISQNTIIFGDQNKSDNLNLQESDLSLGCIVYKVRATRR